MSFSSDVKNELCELQNGNRHCDIAETAAFINTIGMIKNGIVSVKSESAAAIGRFCRLVYGILGHSPEAFCKSKTYYAEISHDAAQKLMLVTGCGSEVVSGLVVQSECCKRAYIRGAFMTGGSLSNPEKVYHMEFTNNSKPLSDALCGIINTFNLNAKVLKRKSQYIVYLKEGENIVDLLNIMGAHASLLNMENVRILKDMRNTVNRAVNCETANLSKTVSSAQKQINDIKYIQGTMGLGYLDEQLEEVARVRIDNPSATLKEIGTMLSPPVGKSGVNHRLRKISRIAEMLRV